MGPITATAGKGAAPAAAIRPLDFTRASLEHTEPAFDKSLTMTTATQVMGPFEVPAFGYLRSITLHVVASGADDQTADNATLGADGPWNTIQEVGLKDVNGSWLVGPFSGYDLYLLNKWGGYEFDADPTRGPIYDISDADGSGDGDYSFALTIPVEIVARNAYGALPNMNAGATYKVDLTLNASGTVYSTAPDTTLPTVRVRGYLNAWTPPQASDPNGTPNTQVPPGLGTTQWWSKTTLTTAVGSNTLRLPRVGHYLRTLILVVRDDNNAREGADAPTTLRLVLDGFDLKNELADLRREDMARKYGYDLAAITAADFDEGVFVYPFSHDFDGHPGGELGHLWLPTSQSSRLEVVGTISNTAGTLDVLTNDVAPASGLLAG